jgi:Tfp pilus assembly protein PilF
MSPYTCIKTLSLISVVLVSLSVHSQDNAQVWWKPIYEEGLQQTEQGQFEAAEKTFKSILKRDKKIAQAHYGLGLNHMRQKPDSRDAQKEFDRAIKIDKKFSEAYYQHALVSLNMKKYRDARQYLTAAVRQDENYVAGWLKLVEVHKVLEDGGDVVKDYKNLVEIRPDRSDFYENYIGAVILYNKESDAISFLEDLNKAHPDSLRFKLDLAYMYYVDNKSDKSLDILSTLPPDKATCRTYLMQAILNFEANNDDQGYAYYWTAVNSLQTEADANAFYKDLWYLMTEQEYDKLQNTPLEKIWRYYYRFWRSRDPDLATPVNERLAEHYQRLRYVRKYYRRSAARGKDKRYKLEHFSRYAVDVKVGDELLLQHLPEALRKDPDLDDAGLIYLRHGKADKEMTYTPDIDEDIPFNVSWKYNRSYNRPEMIFHFVKYGGYRGWLITSLPAVFNNRWELGDKYGFLDPEISNNAISDSLGIGDEVRFYRDLNIDNIEYARLGITTETSKYTYANEPLDFTFDFVTFRSEQGKQLVEFYYAVNGEDTDLQVTPQGNVLALSQFYGFYTEDWDEVGHFKKDKNLGVSLSRAQWKDNGIVDMESFTMMPGRYNFEIHMQDNTTDRLGVYKTPYNLRNLWVDSLVTSDVILSTPIRPRTDTDRFVKEDIAYSPHMFSNFSVDEDVGIYFEVYNLMFDQQGRTNYRITCTLQPRSGYSTTSSAIVGFFKSIFDKEKEVVSTSYDYIGQTQNEKIYLNFKLTDKTAGTYELVIDIEDLIQEKRTRSKVPIIIKG